MRLLVTGGAGFIGSNFVHYVYEQRPEWKIVVYDALSYAGNMANLEGLDNTRYSFIHANICDQKMIDQAVANCDVVVHFAAESHNDNSLVFAWPFIDSNIIGTFRILEAVKKHGKRMHHISTDEVYGDLKLTEDRKFSPVLPYCFSLHLPQLSKFHPICLFR